MNWKRRQARAAKKIRGGTKLHLGASMILLFSKLTKKTKTGRQYSKALKIPLKAHTDRTRFGNATQISDFQCRLALIFFHFFQTFGNVLAI